MLEMESAKSRSQCALRSPHAQNAYVPYMSFNLVPMSKLRARLYFFAKITIRFQSLKSVSKEFRETGSCSTILM